MLTENLISGGNEGKKKRWCINKRVCAAFFFSFSSLDSRKTTVRLALAVLFKKVVGGGRWIGEGGTLGTHPSLRQRKY